MKGHYGHWYGQTWEAAIDNCVSYNEWFKTYVARYGTNPYMPTFRNGLQPYREEQVLRGIKDLFIS
jgi:hypothetical protein